MPYERTKNWRETQADIAKLFAKYKIGDTQWSVSDGQKKAALSFIKDFPAKREWNRERKEMVETEAGRRIAVQITFPIGAEGPERNQVFRVVYWYLKSKLEAVEFALGDGSQVFTFEREFFGNTMVQDYEGRPMTAFDAFQTARVELTPPSNVIALPGAR